MLLDEMPLRGSMGIYQSVALTKRPRDLFVCVVLAQRISRPDSGGYPSDQRDLQDQANDASDGPSDCKKCEPGKY